MLQTISLTNFRTHTLSEFNLDPALTFIIGRNASGKTNLLEALYISSLTKSYRSPISELVNLDSDFFKITTTYKNSDVKKVEIRYLTSPKGNHRTIFINNVKKPAKELIGLVPVVLFEPADLAIITSGPERRRVFVDVLLSQSDRRYLETLTKFKRLLRQRNQLLKKIILNQNRVEDLFVYNLQLVEPIHYLTQIRDNFLHSITPLVAQVYKDISQTNTPIQLSYIPNIPNNKDVILKELERSIDRDKILGFTTRGPHRDQINILLDKHVSADSLSRGEIRTLTLALKIAEIEYLADQTNKKPILLLDDVLSELDPDRQAQLWQTTQKYQTVATTTHIEDKLQLSKHQIITLH